jgi:hypothetical protein
MFGILAVLAFALAVIFHGYAFAPNHWLDWTGMTLIGALLLALHMLGGASFPVVIRRRE